MAVEISAVSMKKYFLFSHASIVEIVVLFSCLCF